MTRSMTKFGINSKKEEGRARKEAKKDLLAGKKRQDEQASVEKNWSVGSKNNSKYLEEEQKRLLKIEKKKELKELEMKEAEELAKISKVKKAVPKLLNNEIVLPSIDNIPSYRASSVDDAIFLLNADIGKIPGVIDKHPEKRVKAAFKIFEENLLPKLKLEHPTLRHSQLREILTKEWKKSPENPHNKPKLPFNASKEEEHEIMKEIVDESLERLKI